MALNKELRRQGVTGTDVAPILGLDEDKDEVAVYLDKMGLVEQEPPSFEQLVGKCLEQGVLELYAHVTGHKLSYCDETMQHPDRPWMIYTPDAFCLDDQRGVDAKVVRWNMAYRWGPTVEDIPDRVVFQALWYLIATGRKAWDICALVGGHDLRIYTVERNPDLEAIVLRRTEAWYQRHLVQGERPPLKASPAANTWLQKTYPTHKRPDIVRPSEAQLELLNHYTEIRIAQKSLDRERLELENAIRDAIGEHEGFGWDPGLFTWRKTKDSEKIDWKSMAIALYTNYIKDEAERKKLLARYTSTKEGIRKIRFTHPLLRGEEEE
jgi:predicted phage-related endonuclease